MQLLGGKFWGFSDPRNLGLERPDVLTPPPTVAPPGASSRLYFLNDEKSHVGESAAEN